MNVFKDLKVLELCRVYSGPLCGMLLSDLGAKVIKIERPIIGDESRQFGKQDSQGRSSYFDSLNRNKEALALDLKKPEAKAKLIQLIKESDVLVHNWLQKSLDHMGFSYDEVKAINPQIIYCCISGYGYNSPYKNYPAQDIIAQSLSGLMSLTGEADRVPSKTGIPIVDYVTGVTAAFAIMSALYMRTTSGKGQLVHTSLLENALAITSFEASKYFRTGSVPLRTGNRHPAICPYNVYHAADGLITIGIANDAMWIRFCQALGMEALANHSDYATNISRLKHQDQLESILENLIKVYQVDQLVAILAKHNISCAKVNNLEEALSHDAIQALNMTKTLEDGTVVIGKAFHLEAIKEDFLGSPPPMPQTFEKDTRK